jgi:hypothetical protein
MTALIFAALAATSSPSSSPSPLPIAQYDVLVSAGHEGRPASCPRFPKRHCNLGAAGERQWTPIVADETARALRASGFSVAREPADFDGLFEVKAAVFIHFDGSDRPCSTGASIGYHNGGSSDAAKLWRDMYARYFPFTFMPDNFTDNLRDYYGFRQVHAADGALVIELGEISCPAQRQWLAVRLKPVADVIADFVKRLIDKK